MKRTIVLFSAVLLVSTLATAGVSNPEPFNYALTDAWAPTAAGEGWTVDAAAPGNHHDITAGTNGNATRVYQGDSSNRDGAGAGAAPGQNMVAHWYANIPDADVAVTKTYMELNYESPYFGDQWRVMLSRTAGVSWAYSWFIELNDMGDLNSAQLRSYDYDGVGNYYDTAIPLPGGVIEPGNWYVVEVEEDNGTYGVGNGQKSRARISLKGGATGAWTDWIQHDAGDNYGLDYSNTDRIGEIRVVTNGVAQYDNFNITPEPATMLLLGAGSLMLLKHKRKS